MRLFQRLPHETVGDGVQEVGALGEYFVPTAQYVLERDTGHFRFVNLFVELDEFASCSIPPTLA